MKSQDYRKLHSKFFVSLDHGKFGGFRNGIVNGPSARTKRGMAGSSVTAESPDAGTLPRNGPDNSQR